MPPPSNRSLSARFAAERVALAASIRGIPEPERPAFAAVLLHRLLFLWLLHDRHPAPSLRRVCVEPREDPSLYRAFLAPLFQTPPFLGCDPAADVDDAALHRIHAVLQSFDTHDGASTLTPALLASLFEGQVDRGPAGAYYTGADVTAYIAANTIVPLLLDVALAECPNAPCDTARYIPAALRRADALPTETTRERQARRHRFREVHARFATGTPPSGDETVTLNIDGLRWLCGLIEQNDETVALAVFDALRTLTVLDPTCGTGAFLFAALDVLEPIARACHAKLRLPETPASRRRFLLERTLHGVDLMPEAVEVCRLRMILRLAESGDIGTLAAIGANVRVGNVLDLEDDGSFDAVIGNPPYLPAESLRRGRDLSGYRTASCPDVYAWILERSARLLRPGGRCGMVVPLSLGFSAAFAPCRQLLFETYGSNWFASFGRIPSALFGNEVRVRNIVHLGHKTSTPGVQHATRLHRWFDAYRPHLFSTITYASFRPDVWQGRVPKLNTPRLTAALEACLQRTAERLGDCLAPRPTKYALAFKKIAYNWLNFCRQPPPCFDAAGLPIAHTQYHWLYFPDAVARDIAFLLLNGSWAFAFWLALGDDFHVTRRTLAQVPLDPRNVPATVADELRPLVKRLERAMARAISFKRNAGKRVGTYNLARCRNVTDESDRVFGELLGLSETWPDVELLLSQTVKTDFEAGATRPPTRIARLPR